MLWKLVPLLLGSLAAYAWRGRAVHEALARRRPFRAFLIWLRTSLLTVPGTYLAAAVMVIITDRLPTG